MIKVSFPSLKKENRLNVKGNKKELRSPLPEHSNDDRFFSGSWSRLTNSEPFIENSPSVCILATMQNRGNNIGQVAFGAT